MRLDPLLKTERTTLVFEAIGDDKVRIGCSSWDHPVVILPNEALEVVAVEKTLYVTRRDYRAAYSGRFTHCCNRRAPAAPWTARSISIK
jgi:hypothetical protein